MALYDSVMHDLWFESAIERLPKMIPCIDSLACNGKISLLKENLSYYEADIYMEIFNMISEYKLASITKSADFSHQLLENVKSRLDLLAKPYLKTAMRVFMIKRSTQKLLKS